MGDRHAHHLPARVARGERALGLLDPQADPAADEAQACVPHQRARQQPGLRRHLEAVADRQEGHARAGPLHDVRHHRRARRHGAGAQIVAVGETAGEHDQVAGRQRRLVVPDHRRRPARSGLQRHHDVAVAVGAGEDDDGGLHRVRSACVPSSLFRKARCETRSDAFVRDSPGLSGIKWDKWDSVG